MFEQIPPKMHAVAAHLGEDVRRFQGIGLFVEDFMEQDHQFGRKDEEKTKGVRSRGQQFVIHCRHDEMRNIPAVVKHEEIVALKSKRKTSENAEAAEQKRKKQRLQKRDIVR